MELQKQVDELRAELARLQRNEDCVQRLIVWANENGWNGVDNSKILDSFIIGLFDALRAELAVAKRECVAMAADNARLRGHMQILIDVGAAYMRSDGNGCQCKGCLAWEKVCFALIELRAERTALAAHVERLEKALKTIDREMSDIAEGKQEEIRNDLTAGESYGWTAAYDHVGPIVLAALAATPAQSLAAHDEEVKVAVLREVADKLFKEAEVTECGTFYDAARLILSEADRIHKGER